MSAAHLAQAGVAALGQPGLDGVEAQLGVRQVGRALGGLGGRSAGWENVVTRQSEQKRRDAAYESRLAAMEPSAVTHACYSET